MNTSIITSKKRIGICTLYCNNRNYGGNLQSYALCKTIKSLGWQAEMITYYNSTLIRSKLSKIKLSLIHILSKKDKISKQLAIRNRAIDCFRESIPHSKLYYADTIKKANAYYDCFITGSDQVWNPDWINWFMSLEFVDETKRTIAYAASVGKTKLTPEQQEKLKRALMHTDVVSIRERETIPALKELTNKPIEYVLDPTLLLTRDEWDEISTQRLIEEKYMFCYFLRDDENLRVAAKQYAKKNNLKIVTLPYLNGVYRKVDDGFGNYALFDISPKDFISLIKYASFVLTDSYHGTVFSHLYERKFAVTNGSNNIEMGCRMQSLSDLFGTEERYIKDTKMVTVDSLENLTNIPLNIDWKNYDSMRKNSIEYLEKVIKQ